MRRTMLGGKIHRATVTEADVHYEGSITLDAELLDAAGILANEQVHVWDVTNGSRFTTYAIPAPARSGACCVNGAAARLVSPGDLVIVACFVELEEAEARGWLPRVAFVDERNRLAEVRAEESFRSVV